VSCDISTAAIASVDEPLTKCDDKCSEAYYTYKVLMKWGNSPFKPSTTATLSFCFNDKVYFKTMAIPFYDEISGHPSSHQSNSTNNSFIHQPSVNNNNDGNRQRRQVSGDGRVIISASPAINSGVTSQQVSFLHQLITELAHIYNSFAPSSSSPSQPVVAQESRASPMQLNQGKLQKYFSYFSRVP